MHIQLKKIKNKFNKIFYKGVCFSNLSLLLTPLLKDSALEDMASQAGEIGVKAGFNPQATVATTMATVIKAFLSVMGIVFIVLIVLAGYGWMTAGGNEEKVTKARTMMTRAVIGLIIIASAYAITYFVFNVFPDGGSGGPQGGP